MMLRPFLFRPLLAATALWTSLPACQSALSNEDDDSRDVTGRVAEVWVDQEIPTVLLDRVQGPGFSAAPADQLYLDLDVGTPTSILVLQPQGGPREATMRDIPVGAAVRAVIVGRLKASDPPVARATRIEVTSPSGQ